MKKIERFRRIWGICTPYHWPIAKILTLLFIEEAIAVVFPIIIGTIVTNVTEKDMKMFVIMICVGGTCGFLKVGILYFRERFEVQKIDFDLLRYLSQRSLVQFFTMSMGQHHIGHSVIKRSVMTKGEEAITGIIDMGIYEVLPIVLTILLPIGFLLYNVPIVGFCVLGAIVTFCVYTVKYTDHFLPQLNRVDALANTVSKKRDEYIRHADLVYINAQEEKVQREFNEENSQQGLQNKAVWSSYIKWSSSGRLFISLSEGVCITISAYLAIKGLMTAGTFVTVSMWIIYALGTLTDIGHMQKNLVEHLAPVDKYFKFLDCKPDIVIPENPIPMKNFRGKIEFQDVSFTYRLRTEEDKINGETTKPHKQSRSSKLPEIATIRNISLVLEEGKRHAFVGKSGAGKSTLSKLILRELEPQQGQVLVDGVNIRLLHLQEFRRNIGHVPQDVSLFDNTMRYNVTFGIDESTKKVTEKELDRVAELSCISEFLGKLENGWDTIIGERGIKLSGGQRQRIGIARALIKDPRILIFDEATSNLDTENEAKIRDSIQKASVGKTTIIIAHRLATVRDADKIFVFDKGKLVGEGSHEELLESNKHYQRLFRDQVIKESSIDKSLEKEDADGEEAPASA